jgi:predicted metalloprotease with PDZ domain
LQKLVNEVVSVYGETPTFDYGEYTFLLSYAPSTYEDGMEHRNSTIISAPVNNLEEAFGGIATVAHEFFHAWNVERIRPKSLEPFDFHKVNQSGELWFAEGFTTYYGYLIMRRAGLYNDEQFATILSYFVERTANSTAHHYHNTVEMSQLAPFADAASFIDATNLENTYVSYYIHGTALALALDLMLRTQFKEISLDTYMKAVWQKYGKTERPYQIIDLQNTLAEVCKDKKFAKEFFEKYIYGKQLPDFQSLLKNVDFQIQLLSPNRAWLGNVHWQMQGGNLTATSYLAPKTPLYEIGFDKGDIIRTINGKFIDSRETYDAELAKIKVGEKVKVEFLQRGLLKSAETVAQENKAFHIVIDTPKGNAESLRKSWLESKVK